MKKIKKIFESIKFKWLRDTGLTLLLIAIIIAVFLALNLYIESLDLTDIDLTSEQLYTLTDTSKEQIAQIPEEDEIQIYLFDYDENTSIVDLAKQYTKVHSGITVEVTTTADRPDLVSEYSILEDSNSILVVSGEKHQLFTYYDLYTYDYNTYETIDISEQRLTNAILSVSSIGETTLVCVLTGHNEYSLGTYLATLDTYLELENYELEEIDLLTEESIPDGCQALIIASPEKDFTELEADKIKDYINNGGNILWMNDPMLTKEKFPNMQSVLDLYGVTIDQDGIMLEQSTSKMIMQSPDAYLPTIEYSALTGDLYAEGTIVLFDSSKLSFVDDDALEELGVSKTEILTTSSDSFYRTDISISTMSPTSDEEVGSQVVGALLEKTIDDDITSKLVVYANNYFATDAAVRVGQQEISAIYFYNNLDLILNSVSYIAEIEDKITIRKNINVTYYTATEVEHMVVMAIIFSVPVLIVIVGIIIWQIRRRKK